jgi:uncharacterized protein YlxW (UPF0749 family)
MTERLTRELSSINESINRIQQESNNEIKNLKKHMKSMRMEGDTDRAAAAATLAVSGAAGTGPLKTEEAESIMPPLDQNPKNLEENLMNRIKEALRRIIDH